MKSPHLAAKKQLRLFQFGWAVCYMLLLAIPASAQDEPKIGDAKEIEVLACKVLVVDPDGNPIEDALVFCSGIRTKIEPGSHWIWNTETHGPVPKLNTNEQGIVEMPYPKYVTEKLETGQMTWSVVHPDFVDFREDRNVDDDPAVIELARGFRIAITAVDAVSGEKIKNDLYAIVGGAFGDWKLHGNGMLVSPMFSKRVCTMRVVQLEEDKPTLFSEAIMIDPGDRSRVLLKDVKLSPGTRVEGRLDDSITRPVRNGYVSAHIASRPKGDNQQFDRNWNWMDKATIHEDGTFVFESLPTDEVLQMIPICDDWIPSKPDQATVLTLYPESIARLDSTSTIPQLVALKGPLVQTTLAMEPSTSVQVTVTTPDGKPLSGATVAVTPNQSWFLGGSQVLGQQLSFREWLVTDRAGEIEFAPDRVKRFWQVTDEAGITVIKNLPPGTTESISVWHDDFELPISGQFRNVPVDLVAGEVAKVTVQLQPKGTEALGADAIKNNK